MYISKDLRKTKVKLFSLDSLLLILEIFRIFQTKSSRGRGRNGSMTMAVRILAHSFNILEKTIPEET